MNKGPGVYSIKCKVTGEVYIGSAVNMLRRVKEHIRDLNHGAHANGNLQAEWERYTQDGFDFTVIEALEDKSQVRIREQYWIDTLNPTFNIARIVEQPGLGLKRSPATLEKLSKALKKSHARMTPEQKAERRQQVSAGWNEWWDSLTEEEKVEARKRRSHETSEETRRVLSEKGKANPSRGMLGKHPSAATIEKIRQARIGKKMPPRSVEFKEKVRQRMLGSYPSAETIEKMAAAKRGKSPSAETRRKQSESQKARTDDRTMSDSTKEKLRQVALAQQADPAYRAKHAEGLAAVMGTPEMRQKLSESHKGKTLTAEHKAAIGAATKGRVVSEETKSKMRETQKSRWAKRKVQSTE